MQCKNNAQIPEALILCSLFIHEHNEDHNDLENLTIVVSTNQEPKMLHNMNSYAVDIIHTIPWAEGVSSGMQISVLSLYSGYLKKKIYDINYKS